MNPDWPALIRLAAVRFAIPPEAFWRLSLAEWRALTGASVGGALTRRELDTLLNLHPDA